MTRVGWTWSVSPDDVRAYLGTHSGLSVLDPDERTRVLDRAHGIVAAKCARVGQDTVPWPQTCACVRWAPGGPRASQGQG